jgi:hypothetical protein
MGQGGDGFGTAQFLVVLSTSGHTLFSILRRISEQKKPRKKFKKHYNRIRIIGPIPIF